MRTGFSLTLLSLGILLGATGWAQQLDPDAPESVEPTISRGDESPTMKPSAHAPCHPYCFKATLESGFTSVLTHTIQWGENGTEFDYVQEGGQSVLLPYWRPTLELEFLRRHSIEFLYQPIYVDTNVVTRRDVRVDNVTFPTGTPLHAQYHFPFYRFTYLYHLIANQKGQLSLGPALQIRNATIVFTAQDGSSRFDSRNVGPVPLIVLRGRALSTWGGWFEGQLGGIWAPIKFLNGSSTTDINGWIYEGHVRLGLNVGRHWAFFMGTRALGGGAIGNDSDARQTGGTYSANVLNTLSPTLGVTFRAGGWEQKKKATPGEG